MTRLRTEYARMLGNGMCNRPAELDCRIESACESCAYFRTGPEFVPVLLRQLITPVNTGRPIGSSSTRGWSTERPRSRLDTDYMYKRRDGRVIDGHVLAIRELPPTGTTGHPVDTQRMGDLGATHSGNVIADPPEADRNQGDGTGDEDRGLAPLERPVTT